MIRCRSCSALIFFAPSTKTGKQIPLDANPSIRGNVALEDNGQARVLTVLEQRQHASRGIPRYLPHWATCPQADYWRAPK